MKQLIGGLFQTQEQANLAYEALERAGFADEQIHTFVHKPRSQTARATEVSIQDIGRSAFVGGLIGALIGGFLGLLVGLGVLPHPYLEPGSVERNGLFIFSSVLWGMIPGGLIGVLLGAASRLLRSPEKAEVMTRQIEKRGVLVTVSVDGTQGEAKARQVLEANGATDVGNPADTRDLDAWMSPNETTPTLKHLVDAR